MRPLELMVGGRIPLNLDAVKKVLLEACLGMGGFGSVWKAKDEATGRVYALKVMQGVTGVDADRARLEAGVCIPSKHIVPVVGLIEWNPTTFLILFEYFKGTSLSDLIRSGSLSSPDRKAILVQILQAVSDAHRCNVIHRDIKPQNILVGADNLVKLIDFGISKFHGFDKSITGEFRGTIPYTAPELIVRGAKSADAKADVYSLGHVMYELSVGRNYWEVMSWHELSDLLAYLNQSPAPQSIIEDASECEFMPHLPSVVKDATAISPSKRIQTVAELQTRLGLPLESAPGTPDIGLRSPLLIVETGTNAGARTVLGLADGETRKLGREDIAGHDPSITRLQSGGHLEFSRSGSKFYVRDLASKSGTMLGGTSLPPNGLGQEIRHADRIKVGEIFLRFAFMSVPDAVREPAMTRSSE